MNCFLRSLSAIFIVLTTLVVLSPVADAQTAKAAATPVPKVAPLAITADSVPFLAASQSLEPLDLKKFGYVEEEFLVSGTANVYDWAADGTLSVKTPNAPYATRILVRRPADASRFSGNVVVEPLNAVRRIDWSWMWGYIDEQILESGDVWVGITMPGSAGIRSSTRALRGVVVLTRRRASPVLARCAAFGYRGRPAWMPSVR